MAEDCRALPWRGKAAARISPAWDEIRSRFGMETGDADDQGGCRAFRNIRRVGDPAGGAACLGAARGFDFLKGGGKRAVLRGSNRDREERKPLPVERRRAPRGGCGAAGRRAAPRLLLAALEGMGTRPWNGSSAGARTRRLSAGRANAEPPGRRCGNPRSRDSRESRAARHRFARRFQGR